MCVGRKCWPLVGVEIMQRILSKAQERRLHHKYCVGDFGAGKWETIQALLNQGMIAEQGKGLVVTDKGKAYCQSHHLVMGL